MIARSKDGREVDIRRVTDYPWYDEMSPEQIAKAQERLDKERASVIAQIEGHKRYGLEPDQELVDYLEWFDADD
jgi:nucleotide-binding universal stress UspA family protein